MTHRASIEISIDPEEGAIRFSVVAATGPNENPATALAVLMVGDAQEKLEHLTAALEKLGEQSKDTAALAAELITKIKEDSKNGG